METFTIYFDVPAEQRKVTCFEKKYFIISNVPGFHFHFFYWNVQLED